MAASQSTVRASSHSGQCQRNLPHVVGGGSSGSRRTASKFLEPLDKRDAGMFNRRLMSMARWLALASLTFALAVGLLSACSNGDGRPSSLVSAPGESGRAGASAGHGGPGEGDAGQTNGEAGYANGDDAGAAGETSLPAAPLAMVPKQLQVDVGCGAEPEPAELVIRNGGLLPLTISSAKTTAGYVVESELPMEIAAMASGTLLVRPPPPKGSASIGDSWTGSLTIVTNEDENATHEVSLDTTLFGGR